MSVHSVLDQQVQQEIGRQTTQKLQIVNRPIAAAAPMQGRGLFEDILLEISSGLRRQKAWAAIVSVALQCFLVFLVILGPLWYTEVLPRHELVTLLTPPPPAPATPPPPATSIAPKIANMNSNVVNGELMAPSKIPSQILMVKEAEAPPSDGVVGGVIGGMPGRQLGGVLGGILLPASRPVVVRGPSNSPPSRFEFHKASRRE
jgi:hypothetical protein